MIRRSIFRGAGAIIVWLVIVDVSEARECVNLQDTAACLDEADSLPLGQRVPLLLVHGWNPDGIAAQPLRDTWSELTTYVATNEALRSAFKTYYFTYYSNVATVPEIGRAMRSVLDAQNQRDLAGFGSRRIAIVAHSMGGLVSRYFLGLTGSVGQFAGRPNGDRLAVLITLGTPHHGSMLANGPAMTSTSGSLYAALWETFLFLTYPSLRPNWFEPNRTDLHWDNYDGLLDYTAYPSEQNVLLNDLNGDTRYDGRIVAYAGGLAACANYSDKYCVGSNLLQGVFSLVSDGVVPISSALFYGTPQGSPRVRTRSFSGYDHSEMTERGDGRLFSQLRIDLLDAVEGPAVSATYPVTLNRGDVYRFRFSVDPGSWPASFEAENLLESPSGMGETPRL